MATEKKIPTIKRDAKAFLHRGRESRVARRDFVETSASLLLLGANANAALLDGVAVPAPSVTAQAHVVSVRDDRRSVVPIQSAHGRHGSHASHGSW